MSMPDDLIPPELATDVEPFSLDALDAYTDADVIENPEADPVAGFAVTDDDLAEWAMAHVAQIDAGLDLLAEQTRARLARIERHHDAAAHRLDKRRQFFEAHLVAYARDFRDRDPKRNKTLRLPSGDVKSTETQPTAAVADDDVVADWARATLPEDQADKVVKVTTKAMVSELRKLVTVGSRVIGNRLHLECGHDVSIGVANDDGEPVAVPEVWSCPSCLLDPIDGAPARPVVSSEPVTELVVRGSDGTVVPGTEVKPGAVTFAVRPS